MLVVLAIIWQKSTNDGDSFRDCFGCFSSDYGDRKENLKDGIWSMAFSDCDSGGNHQKATKKMSATIDNSYCDGLRLC